MASLRLICSGSWHVGVMFVRFTHGVLDSTVKLMSWNYWLLVSDNFPWVDSRLELLW